MARLAVAQAFTGRGLYIEEAYPEAGLLLLSCPFTGEAILQEVLFDEPEDGGYDPDGPDADPSLPPHAFDHLSWTTSGRYH